MPEAEPSRPEREIDGLSDARSAFQSLIDYLTFAGAPLPRRTAGALLREFGSIGRVLSGSWFRLARIVGPRVAALIHTSNQLVHSSVLERVRTGPILADSDEVIRYLKLQLGSLRHERLLALYVDQNCRLIHTARISDGSVSGLSADISRIIHIALEAGASGILVVHNHPSGDPSPSPADRSWTSRLVRVAGDLDLRLVDHIIIAGDRHRSLVHSQADE